MTARCPSCQDPLDSSSIWKSFSWAQEERGRTRCASCAKHLTVKPTSVLTILGVTFLAVLATIPLYGVIERIGGAGLVVAFSIPWALMTFGAAYYFAARFDVDVTRSNSLTEARLRSLEG